MSSFCLELFPAGQGVPKETLGIISAGYFIGWIPFLLSTQQCQSNKGTWSWSIDSNHRS